MTAAGARVERSIERRALSLNAKDRTVDVVCSTDTIDAYGDSVEQVWNLRRYQANPIVLYAHDSRALPIGTSENVRVGKLADGRSALVCTIRFASAAANPIAENVFQCFCEDVLKTVSVGFVPHTVRREKRDGKDVCVLTDNELHELSVTPVPANPDARSRSASGETTKPRTALSASDELLAAIEELASAGDVEERTLPDDAPEAIPAIVHLGNPGDELVDAVREIVARNMLDGY